MPRGFLQFILHLLVEQIIFIKNKNKRLEVAIVTGTRNLKWFVFIYNVCPFSSYTLHIIPIKALEFLFSLLSSCST